MSEVDLIRLMLWGVLILNVLTGINIWRMRRAVRRAKR